MGHMNAKKGHARLSADMPPSFNRFTNTPSNYSKFDK